MKRVLAFILTAFLLFGAIPATFLNAMAVGAGVQGNNTPNQSIDNAYNQAIPESVVIDGNVNNDTAWANNKWHEVDTNKGTWDKESPAESSKSLAYKYQLHYDYEYFYGAFVVNALNCEVTVWLNDGTNTQGGYSHKLVLTVEDGVVTEEKFSDYAGNGPKTPALAIQRDIKASKKDGSSAVIEFRRYLNAFTDPKTASEMQYFVSVKVGEDSLYFPRIKPEGELFNTFPGATYWPVPVDGTNHLVHQADSDTLSPIKIDGKFDEAIWSGLTDFHHNPEDVTEYDYKNGNKNNITFDNVYYNDTYQPSANKDSDKYLLYSANGTVTGDLKGDPINTIYNNNSQGKGEVKFKYMYHTDGEYFYCAAVVEVPKLVYEGVTIEGDGGAKSVESYPTFSIHFYNQTYKAFNTSKQDASSSLSDIYNGWVPEYMIYLNTDGKDKNTNANGLVNISPRINSNGIVDGMHWTTLPEDDTYGKTGTAESAWAKQGEYIDEVDTYGDSNAPATSSIWYFETRVKLDDIKSSAALAGTKQDDLYFSISVSDRPWIEPIKDTSSPYKGYYKYYSHYVANNDNASDFVVAKNYYRNSAWTGTERVQDNSASNAYYYYKNGIQIKDSDCKGDYLSGIVIDSNFDKQNNAELIAADSRINGTDRIVKDSTKVTNTLTDTTTYTYNNGGYNAPTQSNTLGIIPEEYDDGCFTFEPYDGIQYSYVVTADHEYLYFGIALKNLALQDTFRIWLRSPDSTSSNFDHAIEFQYTGMEVIYCSWWTSSDGDVTGNLHDYRVGSWVDATNNVVYAEIRVALSEVGIAPTLAPAANDVLFYYFISAEDYSARPSGTTKNNYGLVSPRLPNGHLGYPANWNNDYAGRVFYNTPNSDLTGRAFDQYDSTMLDYIKIDGKLDEQIWYNTEARTTVQGNNGQWTNDDLTAAPLKNDVFEYSYVIYTGDNYIYGAVELDDEAVKATNSNGSNYTSIQLWLANPGGEDAWGEYANNGEYDNYFYNIYLCSDDYSLVDMAAPGPSGYMFGGSTPSVTHSYYKWGITTANGKTYAEFMIATDSYHIGNGIDGALGEKSHRFNMNEEAGAEYYISVKHPTSDGETLTLTHPNPGEMFYLTHYESVHSEGAGVIYTDIESTTDIASKYLDVNGRWWTHVVFKADVASGGWKVMAIRDGGTVSPVNGRYGFSKEEFEALGGDFIYCVNTGNNYIQVIDGIKNKYNTWYTAFVSQNGREPTQNERFVQMQELTDQGGGINQYLSNERKSAAHMNYWNSAADYMIKTILNSWKTGDIIIIPDLSPTEDVATQAQAMIQKQKDAQITTTIDRYFDEDGYILSVAKTETSFISPYEVATDANGNEYETTTAVTVEYAAAETTQDKPRYYESGFRNIFTYERFNENTSYGDNLPTTSKWYTANCGKLEKNEMAFPETITVDGALNDTGWSEDGWITVDEGINATVQNDAAEPFKFKYQLRNDGKYLYVAAVFENVAYDATNAPSFTLWTKDDGATNWSKYFRVGYNSGKTYATNPTIPDIVDSGNRYLSDNIKYTNYKVDDNGKISVSYNNYIDAVYNNNPTTPNITNGASLGYDDSALYGYTDKLEEYVKGYWYPEIQIETLEYYFGRESAVMKNDDNVNINGLGNYGDTSTVLEFRVALDEIDADDDGFEYFVSAARRGNGKEYTIYYPTVYCEPESEFSYYNLNFPFWQWYSVTAAKVTADDLCGDMYLCNEYAPVVTLGAKFNDNYDGNGSNAIRFGGYYSEDMIRRQEGLLDGEYDQTCDYWHVQDLGIVFQFTKLLEMNANNEVNLTLDTENVGKGSSVGIVNWVQNTNFADYESYAFYVTLSGIPDNYKGVKFTARTYVQYYDFARVSDYYGHTIERSINMISENAQSSENSNLPGNNS